MDRQSAQSAHASSTRAHSNTHGIRTAYSSKCVLDHRTLLGNSERGGSRHAGRQRLLDACVNNDLRTFLSQLKEVRTSGVFVFDGGHTPLMVAARANAVRIEGATPLHYAAYRGHKDALLHISSRCSGGILYTRDNTGKTALMLAAFRGHTQTVSTLLNSSSTGVDVQDKVGWTALMYAAYTGRVAICRELLDCKADRAPAEYTTRRCAAELAHDAGYYEVADMLRGTEHRLRSPNVPDGVQMPAMMSLTQLHPPDPPAAAAPVVAHRSLIERALSPVSSAAAQASRYVPLAALGPPPIPSMAQSRHSSQKPHSQTPSKSRAPVPMSKQPSANSKHKRNTNKPVRLSELPTIPEEATTAAPKAPASQSKTLHRA
ncbi:hypothetical protein LPJ81_002239, partial [Coemansia sp. IMI 209127]